MTTKSTPTEKEKRKLHPDVQQTLERIHDKKMDELAHNPFVAFTIRYKNNPVLFVKEVLKANPDNWQEIFLTHIAKGNRAWVKSDFV